MMWGVMANLFHALVGFQEQLRVVVVFNGFSRRCFGCLIRSVGVALCLPQGRFRFSLGRGSLRLALSLSLRFGLSLGRCSLRLALRSSRRRHRILNAFHVSLDSVKLLLKRKNRNSEIGNALRRFLVKCEALFASHQGVER